MKVTFTSRQKAASGAIVERSHIEEAHMQVNRFGDSLMRDVLSLQNTRNKRIETPTRPSPTVLRPLYSRPANFELAFCASWSTRLQRCARVVGCVPGESPDPFCHSEEASISRRNVENMLLGGALCLIGLLARSIASTAIHCRAIHVSSMLLLC
jgi:hypothetical protein